MTINKPIVFFDLETTGTSVVEDRIVQIAVLKIEPDGSRTEKEMLINPGIDIPLQASEIHGITDEMVAESPTFKKIAKSLKEFFADCDIAGYNSDSFDFPLLMQEFHRCQIEFPDWELNFVDVLKLERLVNSHKLEEVYKRRLQKELTDAHDAGADTRATFEVLMHQIQENYDKTITPQQIDEMLQGDRKRFDYAGKCYVDEEGTVFWAFGKNIDNPVLDDRSYLNWVLNSDFPLETKNKLKQLLTSQN